MIRIDMSEYMEKHSVSRLVGAPPGYVGYEEGGQLTEAVRRRPYSVVLLDEIEKAHARRLQHAAAGDGRRPPDRRPGTHGGLQEHGADHDLQHPRARMGCRTIEAAATRCSRASSRSSSTGSMTSSASTRSAASRSPRSSTCRSQRVVERVAERGIEVTLTPRREQLLGNMGYDPAYGARPLRRVIQKQLTDRLALALLQGEIRDGDSVRWVCAMARSRSRRRKRRRQPEATADGSDTAQPA